MALNKPADYGVDIACIRDADALFTPVTGLALVFQDCIHRLTQRDLVGPGGDDWGYDVRTLIGKTHSEIAALQPALAVILQRDPRIQSAAVRLSGTIANGLADVLLDATVVTTAKESFRFIGLASSISSATFQEQA